MSCELCGHAHTDTEPRVCTDIACSCLTPVSPPDMDVIREMDRLMDRVKYTLDERPELKELSAKRFLFAYWRFNGQPLKDVDNLDDPESVLRAKRKLCEQYPAYRSTCQLLQGRKLIKREGVEEWVR